MYKKVSAKDLSIGNEILLVSTLHSHEVTVANVENYGSEGVFVTYSHDNRSGVVVEYPRSYYTDHPTEHRPIFLKKVKDDKQIFMTIEQAREGDLISLTESTTEDGVTTTTTQKGILTSSRTSNVLPLQLRIRLGEGFYRYIDRDFPVLIHDQKD